MLAKEIPSRPALHGLSSSLPTELYDPKAFIAHAAWLRQAFAHCAIFPTAASRRSLPCLSPSVADHPLRPAKRLRLGRPLPHQLADATQAPPRVALAGLSSPGPRSQETYAVLAVLSDRCPPLKGRLPTCYSPVRRFTQGRSPFLARLACVRPAANVRSEPGSNSPCNLGGPASARAVAGASLNLMLGVFAEATP